MWSLNFRDLTGEIELLRLTPGTTVSEALRVAGLPVNAVIASVEAHVVTESYTPDDNEIINVQQVRHYDLGVVRDPVVHSRRPSGRAVYEKRVLFEIDGQVEIHTAEYGKDEFVDYVESTFVDSITQGVMDFQKRYVVGLSGGRDSVAFLTLIERARESLGPVDIVAVTVTGLPDWNEPDTFQAALTANEKLGFEHVIVDGDQIREVFQLDLPFAEAMTCIATSESSALTMVATHQVMRRMLELEAARRGIANILLGLNADDLVAGLVNWFTTGFQIASLPTRRLGIFEYSYPLHRITKKELTIYLRCVAPELTGQGLPGRFSTGPGERSMLYAVTDHLYGIWPGIESYLFRAQHRMQNYQLPVVDDTCTRCGSTMVRQLAEPPSDGECDVCHLFTRHGITRR